MHHGGDGEQGSYWIPVKNVLEDALQIVLVRAGRQKRKKDRTVLEMQLVWAINTGMEC